MKIGVTGTREGANDKQLKQVAEYLMSLGPVGPGHELHHGDCRGVDVQIAAIAKHLGWRIVCHPPKLTEQQGFFGGDEIRGKKGYMERDRHIVEETELLIVVPLQDKWQPKGGTWYTHDYAVRKGKMVKIFYPNRKE
jgi:hypothetical protein